jgi:hypothetical protein
MTFNKQTEGQITVRVITRTVINCVLSILNLHYRYTDNNTKLSFRINSQQS